jgi:hypothetical protein
MAFAEERGKKDLPRLTRKRECAIVYSAFRRTGCSTTVVSWRRGEEDYICTKRQNVIKKWKTLLKKVLKL